MTGQAEIVTCAVIYLLSIYTYRNWFIWQICMAGLHNLYNDLSVLEIAQEAIADL